MINIVVTGPYWITAVQTLHAARAVPAAVPAPEGFASYFKAARKYRPDADIGRLADEKTAWLVVHKDHLRVELPFPATEIV